jgi:hypothetical protein
MKIPVNGKDMLSVTTRGYTVDQSYTFETPTHCTIILGNGKEYDFHQVYQYLIKDNGILHLYERNGEPPRSSGEPFWMPVYPRRLIAEFINYAGFIVHHGGGI